jgi:hypothetical protein
MGELHRAAKGLLTSSAFGSIAGPVVDSELLDVLGIGGSTFCSHLAMRGAPARAIQELAGHADLTMTQRYMHLSPAALDSAIRLLEQPAGPARSGRNVGDTIDGSNDFGNGGNGSADVKTINKTACPS